MVEVRREYIIPFLAAGSFSTVLPAAQHYIEKLMVQNLIFNVQPQPVTYFL